MLTVESDLSAINPKDYYKLDLTVCIDNKDYNFRTALCKVAELKNGSGVDFKFISYLKSQCYPFYQSQILLY